MPASSTFNIKINNPPFIGDIEVNPKEGVSLQTIFNIEVKDCSGINIHYIFIFTTPLSFDYIIILNIIIKKILIFL